MKHYEIVFLIHPDQSSNINHMINTYKKIVTDHQGIIHRIEDCGRRVLAYPINKVAKAHYVLMNIEAGATLLEELNHHFKFNDAVLRSLVISKKSAVTGQSSLKQAQEAPEFRRSSYYENSTSNAQKVAQSATDSSIADESSEDKVTN